MPFVELNLASVQELDDGRVAAAFQKNIKEAVLDCIDRPTDKSPRVVTLEMKLTPVPTSDGAVVECEGADGSFKVKLRVPERKSKTYNFRTNKKGQLAFSSESPESADQLTFNDVDPKDGKAKR